MKQSFKELGNVYTPSFLVKNMLDFGGYEKDILCKNVIDNSCGDGAFLMEIVERYCRYSIEKQENILELKKQLETYIHGIEIETQSVEKCKKNLDNIALRYNIKDVCWDIINADTFSVTKFNNKIDFIFGNPPYVRVHNLKKNYDEVKQLSFSQGGMTDMFIAFFELSFKMMNENATMVLITPNSWLNSRAGNNLRKYIYKTKNLVGLIDLEHFQPFQATTYTIISKFVNNKKNNDVTYYTYDETLRKKEYKAKLNYDELFINNTIYLSNKENLSLLYDIRNTIVPEYVKVKNGLATLADKVFIGDFSFSGCMIDVLKASTGKWYKCIFPYNRLGKPLDINSIQQYNDVYNYLLENKDNLHTTRDNNSFWYLFGRSQAIKDVFVRKIAVNTIIKDINSIRVEEVKENKGIYSGLYIITSLKLEEIKKLLLSNDFIHYLQLLKNYKSGGYYTFSSKELEQYLNYKIGNYE